MTDTSSISPISFVSRKPRFPLLELHQSWGIHSSSNPKSCHSIRSLSIIPCSSSDTFQTTLGPGNHTPGCPVPKTLAPRSPKVAGLRCFFGSAMFTKATLDKVGAATGCIRKTCLELPTGSRVSQHLRGPGAHGFLRDHGIPKKRWANFSLNIEKGHLFEILKNLGQTPKTGMFVVQVAISFPNRRFPATAG